MHHVLDAVLTYLFSKYSLIENGIRGVMRLLNFDSLVSCICKCRNKGTLSRLPRDACYTQPIEIPKTSRSTGSDDINEGIWLSNVFILGYTRMFSCDLSYIFLPKSSHVTCSQISRTGSVNRNPLMCIAKSRTKKTAGLCNRRDKKSEAMLTRVESHWF